MSRSRDVRLYLRDILECSHKVLRYTRGLSRESFMADEKTYDAVLRNLEIIGEAARQVHMEVRPCYPEVDWRGISGLRDVLAHGYFHLLCVILQRETMAMATRGKPSVERDETGAAGRAQAGRPGRSQRSPRTLAEVLSVLRQHLPELAAHYGVQRLGVFGSYARGTQRRGSDLDLLVELDERPLTLLDFIELQHHIEDLLGMKVDLVEREALRPHIGPHILEELVPV